jgi:mono/diheme cytochrome c family protein
MAAFAVAAPLAAAHGASPQLERGKYLVVVAGCSDCHTPGGLLGHPDTARLLGGSDVGFAIPSHGVLVGPNLTPDKDTGLGSWTERQIVTAITTGARPDGRMLAPIMPWEALSHLTKSDALAIAVYLKSLPAVKNKVPGPFGPDDRPSGLVMAVIPGEVYAGLPKPR